MSFLQHHEVRRTQRHAGRLTPVPLDQVSGVMPLCALELVCVADLVQQMQRWIRWRRGNVVALGGLVQSAAAAWPVGPLMPFSVAGRPERSLRTTDIGEIRAPAGHCRPRLSRHGSACGPARDATVIWGVLSEQGVRSRQERWKQSVLAAPRPAAGLSARHRPRHSFLSWVGQTIRRTQPSETEMVLPASVDMFTGELDYDPTTDSSGYQRHTGWLIKQGYSYVVLDDGAGGLVQLGTPRAMAFKADVGTLQHSPTGSIAQLTDVWTRPDLRERGVGAAALAGVVDVVHRGHTGVDGVVSLYVNDYDTPTLALYRPLGSKQVSLFATVLL